MPRSIAPQRRPPTKPSPRPPHVAASLLCLAYLSSPAAAATEPEAGAATALPAIVVTDPHDTPKHAAAKRSNPARTGAGRVTARADQKPAAGAGAGAPTAAQAALDGKMQGFDQSRDHLLPKTGATSTTIDRAAIQALPQGDNTPVDKLVLEFPGVNYDSAVSNPSFHVRGEYANVQTRINGLVLPEGVSALGPVIDTSFIGSISLLTGTLPAQYGGRTAGVLDITSRAFSTPGGSVSVYGGSHGTITPSFDYGGSVGDTQYFVTGRGNWNSLGLENPTSSIDALHDHTEQGKFFGYVSTLLSDTTRLSIISGASYSRFQIPNNPNQTPLGDFGPTNYSSSNLNENEVDQYYFNMVALQTKGETIDTQVSVFSRYAKVHFIPDVFGDLVFNDVASDVVRESQMVGSQFDASWQANGSHTVRFGYLVTAEKTNVTNVSTVLPVDPVTGAISPTPFTITDTNALLGWNIGTYLQDEWKLTRQLTFNFGLRFDQLYQYVDANQFSPRAAFVYRPFDGTALHAGYARYFTPPMQAQAAQANLPLFANTTNQPEVGLSDPVKPERSHYFDVGIDQKLLPGLEVGVDAYYKIATDQIDDGQFGQAVVLTQFNWAHGYSEGIEGKFKYTNGDFTAHGSLAFNKTRAIGPESNQYVLDAATYNFLLANYHYTDDMQMFTGVLGGSWRRDNTTFSLDMKYGSGLPNGFANSGFNQPYFTANVGVAREIQTTPGAKPLTVRFDVVNLFDKIYEIRDGSGIGVFAPQYGARRGFFAGLSQKL